jgi:hypothetical protein
MSRRRRRGAAPGPMVGGRPFKPAMPNADFRPVDLSKAKEGWRAWKISKDLPAYGLDPKLHSVVHDYTWMPKQKSEAECCYSCQDEGGEGVPGVDCSCGFYSAKSLRHLMQMGYHTYADIDETNEFKIVGQVACWGKVIEGTQGWRSQFSYPTYLMLPYEMGGQFGRRIKDAYRCKVRLLNFLKPPTEITDEFIQGLMAGTPQVQVPTKAPVQGRRVGHRTLRFTGRAMSEVYERDGRKLVDVAWDVNPDKTVATQFDHLESEAH